ncbi:hypothetical protein CAPTEDRAFT_196950 [Capitella teleta]|uniref:Uncharacterized protein n=1 Tax=Capitella teleta TaxID=283909 RepID=R7TBU6_CAPTE|nr:hypothetical protein CAPTEDRAFT_196950 [Capitella teleta]|eukprot:ELT90962.1 hypothetical protein CAPTEDRAFT_196950 [Capitella teleta]
MAYSPFLGLYIAVTLGILILCLVYALRRKKMKLCNNDEKVDEEDNLEWILRDRRIWARPSYHVDMKELTVITEAPRICNRIKQAALMYEQGIVVQQINPECPLHGTVALRPYT